MTTRPDAVVTRCPKDAQDQVGSPLNPANILPPPAFKEVAATEPAEIKGVSCRIFECFQQSAIGWYKTEREREHLGTGVDRDNPLQVLRRRGINHTENRDGVGFHASTEYGFAGVLFGHKSY